MRIRTQFIITILLFGVLIVAISASALVTNERVKQAVEQENIAHKIALGAAELNNLANDYVIYRESQLLARWETRFASFSSEAAGLQAEQPDQQALITSIQANQKRLDGVFKSIVSYLEDPPQNQITLPDTVTIQLLRSQIAVQTQGLASDANQLSQLMGNQADQSQQANTITIIVLVGFFGVYFLLNFLIIQRRIFNSLAALQRGTEVVGSGNLDFRFEEKTKDEIGDLSGAFNRMTTSLKEVTASKTELETEVARRKEIEEELRISNEQLQDNARKLEEEIEERKTTESALAKSEERYRSLFNTMGEGFAFHEIILDENGKPCDYRFLELNDAFEKLTGLSREKCIGRTIKEVLPGVEPYWIETYGRVALTGEPVNFENYSSSLGKWFATYAYSPAKNQFALLFIDVTERKKAEESLKESETQFRVIFERSAIGKALTLPDGVMIRVNQAFADMLGYTIPEMQQLNFALITHPDDIAISQECVSSLLEGKQETCHFEKRYLHRNGNPVWADVTATLMKNSAGEPLYFITSVLNITERKNAEENLKRYTAELENANKELEAFSYSVSHDLRQPLRALDGFSLAVMNDYADKLDETGKDYLDRVRKASQTMGLLIEDLLKLSRIQRAEMNYSDVNLSDLAGSIVSELSKAEPERQVEFIVAPKITVRGDKQLLDIALRNLLENAWKFSRKCSPARIEIGATRQNSDTVYLVRDNGAGFDMKYADKLFQPFQRLHSRSEYEGTGIGLATVQRIIRRHGGRIWIESGVGKGTTVYFTL